MSDMRVADLRSRLETVPSKKLSAFISEAVRAKLNPDAKDVGGCLSGREEGAVEDQPC